MKKYEFNKKDMGNIQNALTGIWFKGNRAVKDINRLFRQHEEVPQEEAVKMLEEVRHVLQNMCNDSVILSYEIEEKGYLM